MAEQTFSFRVISPLGTAFQGDARSVSLPTPDGEITILANHMPLVALLTDGELRIDTGEKVVSIAVAGGFLETGGLVGAPGQPEAGSGPAHRWEATVLSDFATESDSIEVARVEAAKARAEQLLQEKMERRDLQMVERDLQRAILQLKVAEKARSRRRGSTAQ
jgi:F-type H+-transporting ATPase subunit epsilon